MKDFWNSVLKLVTGEDFDDTSAEKDVVSEIPEESIIPERKKKEPKKSRPMYSSRREKEPAQERSSAYSDSSSSYSNYGYSSKSSEYDYLRNKSKVVNMPSGNQNMIITAIKDFSDCKEIVRQLKEKKSVILNVDYIDKMTAKRVVDFLSGAISALDGDIKKLSASIVVVAPHNIKLTGLLGEEIPSNINDIFLNND